MFLKKTPNSKGRFNLAIVDGYYDKTTKKTKHKVIESLGYLDELEKHGLDIQERQGVNDDYFSF